jgi:hypothetical protein
MQQVNLFYTSYFHVKHCLGNRVWASSKPQAIERGNMGTRGADKRNERDGLYADVVNVYIAGCLVSTLCLVDRASRYIRVMKTNLNHYLSSVYFIIQPLHVSGIFVTHHQEIYRIYIYMYNNCYVLCFLVDCLLAGQQTVYSKAQHVPIAVYMEHTSWWWATNMPKICRGWLTK